MRKLASLLILALLSSGVFSQEEAAVDLDEQFTNLKENSETYQEYKVIKRRKLNDFWSIVQNANQDLKSRISQQEAEIAGLQDKITELKEQQAEIKNSMEAMSFQAEHISFWGISFNKNSFLIATGFMILVLLIGIGLISFLFKQSLIESKRRTHKLLEVEREYEGYRQRSLDKYVKIKRDLQTANNKLDELERNYPRQKSSINA